MAEVLQMQEAGQAPRKRKIRHKKGKGKKKMKVFQGSGQKVKMDGKMKKLFRKKARDYNSDDSDDEDGNVDEKPVEFEQKQLHSENKKDEEKSSDDEMEDDDHDDDGDDAGDDVFDDEDKITEHGIMKFSEGSTSYKKACKKIVKRSGSDDVLGPVLSTHENLVVKKLAEEAVEKKAKGDAKKEKVLLREKGHVKPDAFSVSHEKLFIGVATKGCRSSQKVLNPLRSKDAKVIQKRRKEAFFSELSKSPSVSDAKASTSGNAGDEGPACAPIRDNYMLTTLKLKDWDKAADEPEVSNEFGRQEDSSSEDDN